MYCISVHQVTILGWNPHVKPILQMPQTQLLMPFSDKNNMSINKFHAGAIVGDGDRKPWARAHHWLWENFAILRTDCSTLTTYSRAVVRGSYCVLAWTFSCCVINSESCKVLLRIFHSDGWEWEPQPRSQGLWSSRPSCTVCRADCRAIKRAGPSKKVWCKGKGSTNMRRFHLLPVCSLDFL